MKQRAATVLNKRISILTETETVDSLGEPVISETEFCTAWAAIWPVSAGEHIRQGQQRGTITHRVRIRYRSGINHNMRIRYGLRNFKINQQPINPDERGKWLDILAEEET